MCGPDLLASGRMRGSILARLVLNLSSVRLAWSCLALPARLGIGLRAWRGASGRIQDFVEIRHRPGMHVRVRVRILTGIGRSEEHTSELQSRLHLVCRLLLEKKKNNKLITYTVLNRIVCRVSHDSR